MSTGDRRLDEAADQLRDRQPGLARSARRVLRRAMAAPRRTTYVRLEGEHAHVRVSTLALRAALVERLHEALVDAAVQAVVLRTEGERLSGVDLELVVRFGTWIDDSAHLARTQVGIALGDLVGSSSALPPPPVRVQVVDVTSGDPRLTTPQDE